LHLGSYFRSGFSLQPSPARPRAPPAILRPNQERQSPIHRSTEAPAQNLAPQNIPTHGHGLPQLDPAGRTAEAVSTFTVCRARELARSHRSPTMANSGGVESTTCSWRQSARHLLEWGRQCRTPQHFARLMSRAPPAGCSESEVRDHQSEP
jgi:hypothetical protein